MSQQSACSSWGSQRSHCSHRSHRSLVLTFTLGLLLLASVAGAQVRTVLVSPVPGNPTASGAALVSALAGISSPSSTNPWLLKLEPGIYDIGTTSLAMRAWVDIEGSGIDITTIQGSVNGSGLNAGTVNGADNAELRELTVIATGTQSTTSVIGMYNPQASPRLYRVKFVSSGQAAWGVRNAESAPRIEECQIEVTGTGTSSSITYGIVFSSSGNLPASRTSILRSRIRTSAGHSNYGIYMASAQIVTEIRDSTIETTGGSLTVGIFADGDGWVGNDPLAVRDTEISSFGASSSSYGIRFDEGTTIYLTLANSQSWGHLASSNYGVVHHGGSSAVNVMGSSLLGSTQVADVTGSLFIASSSMAGGTTAATVWLGCAGVWDEGAVFYANTCP